MSETVQNLLDLLFTEPDDELSRALYDVQRLVLKHPIAAQAAFRALVAEGRQFAQTEEGVAWKRRLVGSELIRRSRPVWEVATQNMLEESAPRMLPSQYVESLCYAASVVALEPALANSVEPSAAARGGES
jgi:hypothetical protein